MRKHGTEEVTSEGEFERAFPFKPTQALVEFTDPDPVDEPRASHAPEEPDWVKISIQMLRGWRFGIKIRWHVHGPNPRTIRWEVRKY